MKKIIKKSIKCKLCEDVMISKNTLDFASCKRVFCGLMGVFNYRGSMFNIYLM
ncbi:MAG: hypothetical protein RSA91_06590 [Bacilli bacterium]